MSCYVQPNAVFWYSDSDLQVRKARITLVLLYGTGVRTGRGAIKYGLNKMQNMVRKFNLQLAL
jgi:hypothetical protein